jgi:hypothetical protein
MDSIATQRNRRTSGSDQSCTTCSSRRPSWPSSHLYVPSSCALCISLSPSPSLPLWLPHCLSMSRTSSLTLSSRRASAPLIESSAGALSHSQNTLSCSLSRACCERSSLAPAQLSCSPLLLSLCKSLTDFLSLSVSQVMKSYHLNDNSASNVDAATAIYFALFFCVEWTVADFRGEYLTRARPKLPAPYTDVKAAKRPIRVSHGATENAR